MLSKTLTQNHVVLDQLESISRHWGKKMERKPDSFISAEYVAIKSLTAPGNVTGDVNWTVSENNYSWDSNSLIHVKHESYSPPSQAGEDGLHL